MKHVWRVENIEGEGPYRTKNAIVDSYMNNYVSNGVRHPHPMNDELLSKVWTDIVYHSPDYKTWLFGFSSMDQLKLWFYSKECRLKLHKNSFFISHYLVRNEDFIGGTHQAVFRRDTGRERMKETISFETLVDKPKVWGYKGFRL